MKCSVIGIDLAKNIFQICALDQNRKVISNKKVKRASLLAELRQYEPTLVVMEACYSSNPWGRRIQQLGHQVKAIPAFAVKPFVMGNKNDANDALAIAEASNRPKMRFVAIKSVEQQDIQSLQRIRELLKRQRTALINQLRGLLAEYGEVCAKTPQALKKAVPGILEDATNELSIVSRQFIQMLANMIEQQSQHMKHIEQQLHSLVCERDDYQRLLSVPGVGPVVAATVLASVNDMSSFKNGRQFACWVGLTPTQYASGELNRIGKISKRGNPMLRQMLIHGARAVINWCQKKQDKLSCWLQKITAKMHHCKATVALANKLARIIWVVLAKQDTFNVNKACA